MLLTRSLALGTLTLAAVGCGESAKTPDSGQAGPAPVKFSSCIADWPKAPDPLPGLAQSLDVEAPRILWRNLIGGASYGLAMSGHNLVARTVDGITLVDKEGNSTPLKGWVPDYFDDLGDVTTDVGGNIYCSSPSGTHALTPDGKVKWHQREGAVPYGAGVQAVGSGSDLALAPNGVLYGASADGQLRAFRSSDGTVLWRTRPALSDPAGTRKPLVLGGVADVVFASVGGKPILVVGEGTAVFDTKTGIELGRLRFDEGRDTVSIPGYWLLGYNDIVFGVLYAFDGCGAVRWKKEFPNGVDDWISGVVGATGLYPVVTSSFDSSNRVPNSGRISLVDADGQTVVGPVPGNGSPLAIGADETIYTLSCRFTNPPESRLYAYSPSLDEIWHLDLSEPGHCPEGRGVLDDDGVLYLTLPAERGAGADVVAIQTRSPGLASSAWPIIQHDNRGTLWLVPASSGSSADGGATTDGGSSADGGVSAMDGPCCDDGTAEEISPLDSALDVSLMSI